MKIPENGDSSLINNFFLKYDSLKKNHLKKINIVHIGGSHVQAGYFSDQIREKLNNLNEGLEAPRGYIFPYRVAKTNNPISYGVDYKGKWEMERNVKRQNGVELGVGGIAVFTSDPDAEITVKLHNYNNSGVNKIKILGYVNDSSNWAVTPVIRINSPYQRVVYPDYRHIDTSFYEFSLNHNVFDFEVYFQQFDTVTHRFVLTGFVVENDKQGVVYNALGVNGAAVTSYIDCEKFEDELSLIAPDMVVFGIGINDAVAHDFSPDVFIKNYNTLIDKIRRVNPDCAFVFITNNDSFRRIRRRKYAVNKNGILAQEAMYQIAKQNKGAVWDQFEIMGGLGSMRTWQNNALAAKDKVHFSAKGYRLLGKLFFDAFENYYYSLIKY